MCPMYIVSPADKQILSSLEVRLSVTAHFLFLCNAYLSTFRLFFYMHTSLPQWNKLYHDFSNKFMSHHLCNLLVLSVGSGLLSCLIYSLYQILYLDFLLCLSTDVLSLKCSVSKKRQTKIV